MNKLEGQHAMLALPLSETAGPNELPKHYKTLDGLRGVAVIAVILFHCYAKKGTASLDLVVANLAQPLWCGVDLFFVLSGFLITGILLDTKHLPGYFKNFIVRRALRIFPLYYGVLISLFVFLPILGLFLPIVQRAMKEDIYTQLWEGQLYLWFYVQNFLQGRGPHQLPGLGHFWTLAIEEQFYLFWPLIVYVIPSRRLGVAIVVACTAIFITRASLVYLNFDPWMLRHNTFTRIDTLLYGSLVAVLVRNAMLLQSFRKWSRHVLALSLVALVVLRGVAGDFSFTNPLIVTSGFLFLALFFATLIFQLCVDEMDGHPWRLFTSDTLRMFGKYSYALYIFHFPIVHLVRPIVDKLHLASGADAVQFWSNSIVAIVVTCVSLAVAYASWHLYEKHWLHLKSRFSFAEVAS